MTLANLAFLQGRVFVFQTSNITSERSTRVCTTSVGGRQKLAVTLRLFSNGMRKRKVLRRGVNEQQVLQDCVANKFARAHMSA